MTEKIWVRRIGKSLRGVLAVGILATGAMTTQASATVLEALQASATVVANQVAQLAQKAVHDVTNGGEPGNYGFFQSAWHLLFPTSADNPPAAGNNQWGEYTVPQVDSQVSLNKYFSWQKVELPLSSGAVCGDGSNYKFFVNLTNASNNLLIFMEGGGGCTDYAGCTGKHPQRNPDGSWQFDGQGNVVEAPGPAVAHLDGINDNHMDFIGSVLAGSVQPGDLVAPFLTRLSFLDASRVKVQDWNMVFLPYCTGDGYVGDNVAALPRLDGKAGKVMRFNGVKNMVGTLGWLRSNLPRPAQVFLTGQSAGSLSTDVHRLTVRKILNPSDSLYSLADAGFVGTEDPVNRDDVNYPATRFMSEVKKQWWGSDPAQQVLSRYPKTLAGELPGFSLANISNVSELISNKYPEDRVVFVNARSDLNFPNYGYHFNPQYVQAARLTGNVNLSEVPAYFSPLGNYVRTSWNKELDHKISTFQRLGPNQGYFMPSGRRLNQSHCMTALTYEGTTNQDTGHSTVDAINNLLDRSRPPVFREKESDPTRGLYAPLGYNLQAAKLLGGESIFAPPLN
ncbi:pectin acetylesterase-family hydrolase [Variovorax dokdonensis]|uniref:Pectin acetylesterase-family hydrolase n=1 Tax=Variovorax dokdonensis TaxID=344883 RepID=A0ABT7N895_9BURK|nr:pectin acetylesterase-family hydrolase [Variovorax dokdonensis]MDM0044152.1 pectin acetylesterase-family hydrolase [Variovorax dokdonensis]